MAENQTITLADGTANPVSPMVGAATSVFNGTTWDRTRGTVASTHVGNHAVVLSATPTLDTFTTSGGNITGVATTNVLTAASAHGFAEGDQVKFATLTGGAGLAVGTLYYVIAAGLTATDFEVSATSGGAAVDFTTDITAGTIGKTFIYASGDSLHTTVISFANAVAASGGSGTIKKLLVIDADLQSAAGELWLFSATVTPAAANAAHSISDAHAAKCIGVIPFGTYYASALNSVSVASPALPFTCDATTLFGILVTRATPTYTAAGLTVKLIVSQD